MIYLYIEAFIKTLAIFIALLAYYIKRVEEDVSRSFLNWLLNKNVFSRT